MLGIKKLNKISFKKLNLFGNFYKTSGLKSITSAMGI